LRYIVGMFQFRDIASLYALIAVVLTASAVDADEPYRGRLFDAHVHYSRQVWNHVNTKAALGLLAKAGITSALTSSTPDEGTWRLVREKQPHVHIVPFHRPYQERVDIASWFKKPDRLMNARAAIQTDRYKGFGEVHIHAPINTAYKRVQDLIRRVADTGLFIHPHAHHDVISRIFKIAPNSKVIWAHAGFDPPEVIGRMMDRHKNLWADLSYREVDTFDTKGIIDVDGIDPEWKALLIRHADRFMVGSDTWNVGRWKGLQGIIEENRMWLGLLPKDVADKIAHQNGERLFGRPK